jgi:hypothetical protein
MTQLSVIIDMHTVRRAFMTNHVRLIQSLYSYPFLMSAFSLLSARSSLAKHPDGIIKTVASVDVFPVPPNSKRTGKQSLALRSQYARIFPVLDT